MIGELLQMLIDIISRRYIEEVYVGVNDPTQCMWVQNKSIHIVVIPES